MKYLTELETMINDMVQKGRGVLAADDGKTIPAAQQAPLKRARLNHLAMPGEYNAVLENG